MVPKVPYRKIVQKKIDFVVSKNKAKDKKIVHGYRFKSVPFQLVAYKMAS